MKKIMALVVILVFAVSVMPAFALLDKMKDKAECAAKEKGEEAFRRLSEHVARGVLELMKVPVEVHNREFIDRVL